MRKPRRIIIPFILCAVGLASSSCDMNHPTYVHPQRAQVDQGRFHEEISLSEVDRTYARNLGTVYDRSGEGPVNVTVTYDQFSQFNTPIKARTELGRIQTLLKEAGIPQIEGSILPVYNSGEDSQLLVSFKSYKALPPEDCTVLPGLEDRNVEANPEYRLGCTVETLQAKQIARPRDLLGRDQRGATTDGRRGGNIIETYRSGVPNESLGGEKASGD
ncbi:MAG: CpaD family pilus assembly protein [Alphaproteobacteria bacterium]|nr:CpaD family pilus assembly protein [Alphaproteobacteria bacterium]